AQVDLTGTWLADDGGTYYVRQLGQTVWWAGVHVEPPDNGLAFFDGLEFTNVFQGRLAGTQLTGEWVDVPKGRTFQNGSLALELRSPNELHRMNATGGFGGSRWNRVIVAVPPPIDVHEAFKSAKKNGGDTLLDNLKPYKDYAVLVGTAISQPSLNY